MDLSKAVKGRFEEKYRKNTETGCWEWIGAKNPEGYGRISINGVLKHAHRISYRIYCDPIPDGLQINHTCHNECCVNPGHLYAGSQKENIEDSRVRGTLIESRARGEDSGKSKLTESNVVEIREKYQSGEYSQRGLADEYGVSKGCIQDIIEWNTWRHIDAV